MSLGAFIPPGNSLLSDDAAAALVEQQQAQAEEDARAEERRAKRNLLALLLLLGLKRKFTLDVTTRKEDITILRRLIADSRQDMADATVSLAQGRISLARWQARLADELGPLHYAATMAVLGTPDLTPADRLQVRLRLERQLQYLEGFAAQVRSGSQLLDGTAVSRAQLYASAAWQTAQNVALAEAQRDGYTEARRVLGFSRHCNTCVNEAGRGWVPIDEVLPLGDSECRANCHCWIEYR